MVYGLDPITKTYWELCIVQYNHQSRLNFSNKILPSCFVNWGLHCPSCTLLAYCSNKILKNKYYVSAWATYGLTFSWASKSLKEYYSLLPTECADLSSSMPHLTRFHRSDSMHSIDMAKSTHWRNVISNRGIQDEAFLLLFFSSTFGC